MKKVRLRVLCSHSSFCFPPSPFVFSSSSFFLYAMRVGVTVSRASATASASRPLSQRPPQAALQQQQQRPTTAKAPLSSLISAVVVARRRRRSSTNSLVVRASASFDSLSNSLSKAWDSIRIDGKLTAENIKGPMREIRRALLEADVSFFLKFLLFLILIFGAF